MTFKNKINFITVASWVILLVAVMPVSTIRAQSSNNIEATPNRYIVILKDQVSDRSKSPADAVSGTSVRQAAERLIEEVKQNQLSIQNKLDPQSETIVTANRLDRVYEHALKGFSATLTPEGVALLRSKAEIDDVLPDIAGSAHIIQSPVPSWGLDRIDQTDLPLDGGYEYFTDGSDVHVYILDSGIRASHQEFVGRVGNGFDAQDNDSNPQDCNGHGTHVAGTLGGLSYGVAKNVVIHPVRVLDCNGNFEFASIVIAGIDWVIQNKQQPAAANMSLGTFEPYSPLDMAAENLVAAGITTVVSAGNNNQDACTDGSPARTPSVITVASATITDARSSFSNTGSCVDLFAPGSSINSAWLTSDTASAVLDGTSMATPHVAGVVAMFLEENPMATPAQVTNAIMNGTTANRISNPGPGTPNRLLYSKLTETPSPPPEENLAWLVPIINLLLL